jgi:hypothetical protein
VEKVTCASHGEAYATYICEHLVGAVNVDWYSEEPNKDDLWPDAWCARCQREFAAEGEWNEKSERAAGLAIKLICHHCYEQFRSQCRTHNI